MEDDFLDNHKEKCRCCFENFTEENKKVRISKKIVELFMDLTSGVPLTRSKTRYSEFICEACNDELEGFTEFKKNAIEKQEKLYQFVDGRKSKRIHKLDVNSEEEPHQVTFIKVEPKVEVLVCQIDEDPMIQSVVKQETIEPSIVRVENIFISPPEHLYDDAQSSDDDLFERNFKDPVPARKRRKNTSKKSKQIKLKCTHCARNFKLQKKLEEHINKDHLKIKNLKCTHCDYKTSQSTLLQTHITYNHFDDRERQQCNTCGILVVDIKNHIRNVHEKPRNFVCDVCGYGIHSRNRLRRHMFKHLSKETRYQTEGIQCTICGVKLVGGEKGMKNHMRNIHSENSDGPITCHCGKVYKNEASYKNHQKSAHLPPDPKKEFDCSVCGKKFLHKQSLKEHKLIHTRNGSRGELNS